MNPAFLRIQNVSPTKIKVTIVDASAPTDSAQEILPEIPPPVNAPKKMFSFYCDPDDLVIEIFARHKGDKRVKVDVEPSE